MTKLTENAFRDVNIAFANELSMICDKLNVNVMELINFANHHPRVNILQPGAGVGGHCIAVDPWFIVNAVPNEAKLIRTAREVNESKPKFILRKIKKAAATLQEPIIACFGLAYKANTDDLRESPAIKIVEELANSTTHRILVVEPNIKELPPALKIHLRLNLVTIEEALNKANIAVVLVAHDEFKFLDKEDLDKLTLINAAYVDFNQSLDPIDMSASKVS
jgi:UDP-N-acetyl-D-mannosaminuronic acid dehydrogenase